MNFSGGLRHYRVLKGVTQKELAEEIGTNNTTVSNWEKGISKPDMDTLVRLSNYFGIAVDELIFFGEKPTQTQEQRRPIITSVKEGDFVSIPIVDISAAAGSGAINGDHVDVKDIIRLPRNMVRRGDTYHCVQIVGQSMAPTLQNGGYIISRLLDRSEWSHLKDQYIYVVTTNDGKTYVKRIKDRLDKRGFIVCTSDNPDKMAFRDFDVLAADLQNLWEVEWYLSSNLPNIHATYYSKLQDLEDNFEDFKATMLQEIKKLH
jgi:transcriptional regulator with XRE-family HTH domain